jgi:hypothetical protein
VAEKQFQTLLTDRDRIVYRITTGHGATIEHYSLQYECRFADTDDWTRVRRYDCSDRIVHVHAFAPDGSERRREHESVSFKDGLQIAKTELSQDWERFRRTYETGMRAT